MKNSVLVTITGLAPLLRNEAVQSRSGNKIEKGI